MNAVLRSEAEERVLALAPTAADGILTRSILTEAGLASHVCVTVEELCQELTAGAGALLLTDEFVTAHDSAPLIAWLAAQPAWSELPIVFLCGNGAASPAANWALEKLGNVTVLERPARIITLVTMLRSTLKARRRQYQAREEMVERQHAAESLQASEAFNRAILNSLPSQIAVIDATGRVLAVNEPWGTFAREHAGQATLHAPMGADYIATCRPATAHDPAGQAALARIERVLRGEEERVSLEHAYETRERQRWFLVQALRTSAEIGGAIITQIDITEQKRVEAALRESEERLRLANEAGGIGTYVANFETGRISFSPELASLLGRLPGVDATVDEAFERVHPDDLHLLFRSLEKALSAGGDGRHAVEVRIIRPGGDIRWLSSKGEVEFRESDALRVPVRQIGAMYDITERKRTEEALAAANAEAINQKNRLEAIMEALPIGLAITDSKGGRARSNPAYEKVWGSPLPAVKNTQDYEAYRAWWADSGRPVLPAEWASARAVQHGETVIGQQLEIARFDGARAFVLNSAAPIRDAEGFVVGSAVGIQDVTALRQAEDQLREAGRRKDQFLAMLAHELRNPMAAVRSALEVMGAASGGNEVLRQTHGVMERQVKHLGRLVDDLLEVSRITTGRIHLRMERVNLKHVVERAVERVRPLLQRRQQELSQVLPQADVWLRADSARLEQVLGNLLDNASKYGAPQGQVSLIVEAREGEVHVRVRDNGMGISAAELPTIFDLFTQGNQSLDRAEGGLGVGLALVKGLVISHGGAVEASSPGLGHGSEFLVKLPLLSAADTATQEPLPPPENWKAQTLRVLLVDDNLDAARMSAILLDSWGHEVCTAHNGPEALVRAQEFRPHVILLDIGLPEMDGYEVARRLRQNEQFQNLRLVAVSGYGRAADRARSQAAGIDVHLVKPVDASELRRLLESYQPVPA